MKFRLLIIFLLALPGLQSISAQDSNYFRAKLGKPSEIYRTNSGAQVLVEYDEKGQVYRIDINDPAYRSMDIKAFGRFMGIAADLVPSNMRGKLKGTAGEIGNCINVKYEDYERVFMELNENACYQQSVRVYFKRDSCPKPPIVRNLLPVK
jgi:hypothetical protein